MKEIIGYENYCITQDAKVFSKKAGLFLKQSKSKSVSSTKSINKMMKASHPTIYTSVNPCHKKR